MAVVWQWRLLRLWAWMGWSVEDPCSIGTVLILCLLRLECSSFRCLASVLVYSDARRSCAVGTGVCLNKHAFQDGGGSDQVISTACDYFQFSLLIFDSACRKSMILIRLYKWRLVSETDARTMTSFIRNRQSTTSWLHLRQCVHDTSSMVRFS